MNNALRAKRIKYFSAALCGSSPFSALKFTAVNASLAHPGEPPICASRRASAGTGVAGA
jgi:hypothetical protein